MSAANIGAVVLQVMQQTGDRPSPRQDKKIGAAYRIGIESYAGPQAQRLAATVSSNQYVASNHEAIAKEYGLHHIPNLKYKEQRSSPFF